MAQLLPPFVHKIILYEHNCLKNSSASKLIKIGLRAGYLSPIFLLGGCLTISDLSAVNQSVPAYFTDRDFVSDKQVGPLGGDIGWFAGRLGYKGADGKFIFTDKLVVGSPSLKVTTLQKSPDYHSVLTSGFTGSAGLPMLKADASGDTATDYEITDIANIVVPDEAKPSRAAALAAGPVLPPGTALWWVNVVGLSTVRYSVSTNSKGSSTLSGSAYSASGTVYDNESVGAYLPLVSVLVQPMNDEADKELLSLPPPAAPPPPPAAPLAAPPPAISHRLQVMTQESSEADSATAASTSVVPLVRWQARLPHTKGGLVDWTLQQAPAAK